MTESTFREAEILSVDRPSRGPRRRFSVAEKLRILAETDLAGETVSAVARRHKISPSQLFNWRRLRDEGVLSSLGAEERVVPESEIKKLKKHIRELERQLGRKTMEVEILREAVDIAREKKLISQPALPKKDDGQ
jgi:transposase